MALLEYFECVGDDMQVEWGIPFPKMTKQNPMKQLSFLDCL